MRLSEEDKQLLASINRNYPAFEKFINTWKQKELNDLPNVFQNTGVQQGRCQVLQEMEKLVKNAPDYVAQSR